jgi:hypothetical protein
VGVVHGVNVCYWGGKWEVGVGNWEVGNGGGIKRGLFLYSWLYQLYLGKIKSMVFTVEIDDKSKTGNSILQLLKDLSKTSGDIHFLETVEDDVLLEKMKRSLKSGKASKQEVSKTLKAITG